METAFPFHLNKSEIIKTNLTLYAPNAEIRNLFYLVYLKRKHQRLAL